MSPNHERQQPQPEPGIRGAGFSLASPSSNDSARRRADGPVTPGPLARATGRPTAARLCLRLTALAGLWGGPAVAAPPPEPQPPEVRLEQRVQDLELKDEQSRKRITQLEWELDGYRRAVPTPSAAKAPPNGAEAALDRALAESEPTGSANAAGTGANAPRPAPRPISFRLIDISADVLIAAGASSERDESLQNLQGGGHDPRKRGFTVQNVELSFAAAVDPYLTSELHLIYFLDPISGESTFELEEAFATTQALPGGLEIEFGQFFTEFGRINPRHPHQWDFVDQPVIHSRVFGPDGMRGPGVRVGWLTPLPFYSEFHVGVQNANGETMASFLSSDELAEERPLDGRPFVDREVRTAADLVYLARWVNGFDLSPSTSAQLGGSVVFGPNSTGTDGRSIVWGIDVLARWVPAANERGYPFVEAQAELVGRDYRADAALDLGDDEVDPADDTFYPRDTLEDWGVYAQLLYGFRRGWTCGVRYEYATAASSFAGRSTDPWRDDRQRISPLISWMPTEFSRVRLQYNYDDTQHLTDNTAHSVWLSMEFLFGSHPAHRQ
ncbi:MAG: TonB-dependent receptor [Planctomycetota bacterium]